MMNYLKAEMGRLFKKRSAYIYYGTLVLLFFLIIVLADMDILEISFYIAPTVSFFIVIQSLLAIYCDDLSSKTSSNVISTGISRLKIILAKLIIMIVYTALIVLFLSGVLTLAYLSLGGRFNAADMVLIKKLANYEVLLFVQAIAFSAIASVFAFSVRRSTIVIIVYIVLFVEIINNLVQLIAVYTPAIHVLTDYTLTRIIAQSLRAGAIKSEFWPVAALYSVGALLASYYLFRHKDIQV